MVQQLAERGITVMFKGASPDHARLPEAVGTLQLLVEVGHVFDDLVVAVDHAAIHVRADDCEAVASFSV